MAKKVGTEQYFFKMFKSSIRFAHLCPCSVTALAQEVLQMFDAIPFKFNACLEVFKYEKALNP